MNWEKRFGWLEIIRFHYNTIYIGKQFVQFLNSDYNSNIHPNVNKSIL